MSYPQPPPPPCVENYYTDMMCEGKTSGGYPEVGSTITSLVIIWCGVHMLLFWRTESQLLLLIGASFFVNGWSALLSHATGDATSAIIDRWSLVLTVWLVMAFVIDEFTQAIASQCCRSPALPAIAPAPAPAESPGPSPPPSPHALSAPAPTQQYPGGPDQRLFPRRDNRRRADGLNSLPRLALRGAGYCLCLSAAWLFLAIDAQQHQQWIVEVAFAIPLVMTLLLGALLLFWVYRKAHSAEQIGQEAHMQWQWAYTRLVLGVIAAGLGVLSNFATENFCEASDLFTYFPGHALWHVLCAWGLLNCLLVAALLRLDDSPYPVLSRLDQNEYPTPWQKRLAVWYFWVLPGFEFVPQQGWAFEAPCPPLAKGVISMRRGGVVQGTRLRVAIETAVEKARAEVTA